MPYLATQLGQGYQSCYTCPTMLHPLASPLPIVLECSFLTGMRCTEPPSASCSTAIDAQLTSSAISTLTTMAVTWERVKLATTSDKDMVQLVSTIETGFPDSRHKLPQPLQEYHQFRDDLYTVDGVVLYKARIVIPPSLRQDVLSVLHSAPGRDLHDLMCWGDRLLVWHHPRDYGPKDRLQQL